MKKIIIAEILENKQVKKNIFNCVLKAPWLAENSKPGQFLEILINRDCAAAPLLRRPFGVHNVERANGTVEILYKVLGKGTQKLSQKKPGETLDILGPLGNGFTINKNATHFVAGGGMGIAPMLLTAKKIKETGEKLYIFLGAGTQEELVCKEKFESLGELILTTDDGTCGEKCFLNVPLERTLKDAKNPVIYACGPHPMLKCLAELGVKYNAQTQLSLEERMACGLGVCQGCPVELKNNDTKYKLVCKDGPVFNAEDIVW